MEAETESSQKSVPAGGRKAVPAWLRIVVGQRPKVTLIRIVVLVVVVFVTFKFFLAPIKVVGMSMAPTYQDGQIRLVNRMAFRNSEPQRGDVVTVQLTGDSVFLLKRVIGLPGEEVAIRYGVVHIDGDPLDEPYVVMGPRPWVFGPRVIPEGHYFLLGDNRDMAQEDHDFGWRTRERISGKVIR